MMELEAPPGGLTPQSEHADGGGVTGKRRLANHWKQWGAKPEAVGRRSRPMLVRLQLGKPAETPGRKTRGYRAAHAAPRSFGCMANHGKPWGAKPEAKGPAGSLRQKVLRSFGYRTLFASEYYAKKGKSR